MPEKFTRTYPDGTRGAYSDKRRYPVYVPGDSTADYVRRYFELNTEGHKSTAYAAHVDHMALYQPLPSAPAAVYTGVDSVEVTDDAA